MRSAHNACAHGTTKLKNIFETNNTFSRDIARIEYKNYEAVAISPLKKTVSPYIMCISPANELFFKKNSYLCNGGIVDLSYCSA